MISALPLIVGSAETDPFITLVEHNGPFAALLLIILWGGFKKNPWWVFGWYFRDLLANYIKLEAKYDARGDRLDKYAELLTKSTTVSETLAHTTAAAVIADANKES